MKDMIFKVDNNEYTIVKSIQKDNSNFIIYKDKNNEVYASKFEIISNELILNPIKDENDWDYIDSILEEETYV